MKLRKRLQRLSLLCSLALFLSITVWLHNGVSPASSFQEVSLNNDNRRVLGEQINAHQLTIAKPTPVPFRYAEVPFPAVSAQAVSVVTQSTNLTLAEKNSETPLPIASVTKLVSALVAVDTYKMDQIVTVPDDVDTIIGSQIDLRPKEKLTVHDLLKGMLISSGNDAAYTVARAYPSGYAGFVAEMNKVAQELHLQHSHFSNPVGFDMYDNYSSSADIAVITRHVLENQILNDIVHTTSTTIQSVTGFTHILVSTNPFISRDDIGGVKTGTSPEAGQNIVLQKQDGFASIIIVVLDSKDRVADANAILQWIDESYVF